MPRNVSTATVTPFTSPEAIDRALCRLEPDTTRLKVEDRRRAFRQLVEKLLVTPIDAFGEHAVQLNNRIKTLHENLGNVPPGRDANGADDGYRLADWKDNGAIMTENAPTADYRPQEL